MKRVLLFHLALVIFVLVTACSKGVELASTIESTIINQEIQTITSFEGTETTVAVTDIERKMFLSLHEYTEFKSDNEQYCEYIAAPVKMLQGMSLNRIRTVRDVYFTVSYIFESEFSQKHQNSISNFERSSTVDFVTYLYDNPTERLKNRIIDPESVALESNPGIYYYPVTTEEGDSVLYYYIQYLQDNRLIQVNFPAIFSIEETLPYIETQMVSCFDEEAIQALDNNQPVKKIGESILDYVPEHIKAEISVPAEEAIDAYKVTTGRDSIGGVEQSADAGQFKGEMSRFESLAHYVAFQEEKEGYPAFYAAPADRFWP